MLTRMTRAQPALRGNFREGINHASRELLVYDPGGQTTPTAEYANAHAGTQRRINILSPCVALAARNRLLFRLPHKILAGYDICLPVCARVHTSPPLFSA